MLLSFFYPSNTFILVSADSYPKVDVFLALLFNLITLVSTITVQIPIQTKLDQAFSIDLIEKLIATDMIWRRIPMLLLAITNFSMLYMVVRRSNK